MYAVLAFSNSWKISQHK